MQLIKLLLARRKAKAYRKKQEALCAELRKMGYPVPAPWRQPQ